MARPNRNGIAGRHPALLARTHPRPQAGRVLRPDRQQPDGAPGCAAGCAPDDAGALDVLRRLPTLSRSRVPRHGPLGLCRPARSFLGRKGWRLILDGHRQRQAAQYAEGTLRAGLRHLRAERIPSRHQRPRSPRSGHRPLSRHRGPLPRPRAPRLLRGVHAKLDAGDRYEEEPPGFDGAQIAKRAPPPHGGLHRLVAGLARSRPAQESPRNRRCDARPDSRSVEPPPAPVPRRRLEAALDYHLLRPRHRGEPAAARGRGRSGRPVAGGALPDHLPADGQSHTRRRCRHRRRPALRGRAQRTHEYQQGVVAAGRGADRILPRLPTLGRPALSPGLTDLLGLHRGALRRSQIRGMVSSARAERHRAVARQGQPVEMPLSQQPRLPRDARVAGARREARFAGAWPGNLRAERAQQAALLRS